MPRHASCAACGGFVCDPAAACLHCGARPRRFRTVALHLARLVFGVSAAVTLMACYADTSDYDCYPEEPYCNGWTPDAAVPDPDADPGCDEHIDCPYGYRCAFEAGSCVLAQDCTWPDVPCPDGERCELSHHVCVPCEGAECGTCTGAVICDQPQPICLDGTVPGVLDGCWTQSCLTQQVCAEQACAPLDDAACLASEECFPIYGGVNCSDPEGIPCTIPGAECTCESYVFLACVPEIIPPPPET